MIIPPTLTLPALRLIPALATITVARAFLYAPAFTVLRLICIMSILILIIFMSIISKGEKMMVVMISGDRESVTPIPVILGFRFIFYLLFVTEKWTVFPIPLVPVVGFMIPVSFGKDVTVQGEGGVISVGASVGDMMLLSVPHRLKYS